MTAQTRFPKKMAEIDWYKPNDLTVSDVYYAMPEDRRDVLNRMLKHSIRGTLPNGIEAAYLSDVFNVFTTAEKIASYYLVYNAKARGEEIFTDLETWNVLSVK